MPNPETDPAKRTILLILLSEKEKSRANHTGPGQAAEVPASGAQPHPQSIYQAILAQQLTQVRLCSALLVTVEKCNESFDSVCRFVITWTALAFLSPPISTAWHPPNREHRAAGNVFSGLVVSWITVVLVMDGSLKNLQGEAEQLRSRAPSVEIT